jgi:hypothetical protein
MSDARSFIPFCSLWIATYRWFKQINVTYCSRDVGIATEEDAFAAAPFVHRATGVNAVQQNLVTR